MQTSYKHKKHLAGAVALALAALIPLQAFAHRIWLLPSSTQLEDKEPWITVDAAVSENLFEFDTNTLKLDGLSISGPDGVAVAPQNQFAGRLRSGFDLKLPKEGTYKISMVSEAVMASYKLNGEMKRWRGTSEALQKEVPANAEDLRTTTIHNRLETYVTAGRPSDSVLKPVGTGLEIIPLTHPNELQAGKRSNFRVQLDGKPLGDFKLSVVPGGVRYRGILKEIPAKTNSKGEFSVVLPEPGMYWIGANYPARSEGMEGKPPSGPSAQAPEQSAQPAQRFTYSGTFEVLPM